MALTFFTWNLAMLGRSDEAPHTWRQEHQELGVTNQVLDAEADVVLFQEVPQTVPYLPTHDMIRANPKSHEGHLATLVSHDALAREDEGWPRVRVIDGCGILTTFGMGLTIANVHLAPGPAGVAERLEQLARVVESSPTPELLVVGDLNTRVDEAAALADAGLHGEVPPSPTWDGKRNRYRSDMPKFTAYFTRWFATANVSVGRIKVWKKPTMWDDHAFHLSDHHALSGVVDIV